MNKGKIKKSRVGTPYPTGLLGRRGVEARRREDSPIPEWVTRGIKPAGEEERRSRKQQKKGE